MRRPVISHQAALPGGRGRTGWAGPGGHRGHPGWGGSWRWVGVLAWLIFASSVLGATANIADLKASYLTKLPLFLTWPEGVFPDRTSPVVIGILGEDPFGPAFEAALRPMRVDGRPYEVRRYEDLSNLEGCHILYLGKSEQGRAAAVLKALGNRPVLTVGDFPGFAASGGMFNFILEEGRVRFECNREALLRGGVKASGKLLQISRIVREEAPSGER